MMQFNTLAVPKYWRDEKDHLICLIDRVRGPQLRNPCNCLPKTQVCANTKVDVYGLTPAQCWKVKGSCVCSELKPR